MTHVNTIGVNIVVKSYIVITSLKMVEWRRMTYDDKNTDEKQLLNYRKKTTCFFFFFFFFLLLFR